MKHSYCLPIFWTAVVIKLGVSDLEDCEILGGGCVWVCGSQKKGWNIRLCAKFLPVIHLPSQEAKPVMHPGWIFYLIMMTMTTIPRIRRRG